MGHDVAALRTEHAFNKSPKSFCDGDRLIRPVDQRDRMAQGPVPGDEFKGGGSDAEQQEKDEDKLVPRNVFIHGNVLEMSYRPALIKSC